MVKRNRRNARAVAASLAVPSVLVGMLAVFSLAMPTTFSTRANWQGMIASQAILLILALAVTLPLRAGDFDLSIGSVAALSAVMAALATVNWHWPAPAAVVLGLASGVGVGILNSIAVLVARIDAFIATLASMAIIDGLLLWITNTTVIVGVPNSIVEIARQRILGIPVGVFYGWILGMVLWYVFERTPFGRYSLFVSGNHEVARLAGIRIGAVRAASFIACSFLSSIAGIVLLGTIGVGDPSVGSQYLLQPYAAAFLGATAIQVGRFNVVGTIVGIYLIVVGVTGLELLGAPLSIAQVFYGGVLLIAVGLARLAAEPPSRG